MTKKILTYILLAGTVLLIGYARAADFAAPYPDGPVQATAWNFSGFKLEIAGVWYWFPTPWTFSSKIGSRTDYQSAMVYDSTGQKQAQVVAELYRPYCGRSVCVIYEPLLHGSVLP